jgi:biopolymer transport protein ExbD
MRRIRRSDMSVRWELTPLLDVVFLLLTFFIFVVADDVRKMISVNLLPVRWASVGRGGAQQLEAGAKYDTVRIEGSGAVVFNDEHVTLDQLDQRLTTVAADPARSRVFVMIDAQGTIDRLPTYRSIEVMLRAHNLILVLVGQPGEKAPASPAPAPDTGGPAPANPGAASPGAGA